MEIYNLSIEIHVYQVLPNLAVPGTIALDNFIRILLFYRRDWRRGLVCDVRFFFFILMIRDIYKQRHAGKRIIFFHRRVASSQSNIARYRTANGN